MHSIELRTNVVGMGVDNNGQIYRTLLIIGNEILRKIEEEK